MGYLNGFDKDFSGLSDLRVSISEEATCFLDDEKAVDSISFALMPEHQGIPEQCDLTVSKNSDCDLVIGIDFGTSYTKVAIGDRQLNKSYAVPFRDCDGLDKFLIPSTIYVSQGEYSLVSGNETCDDLKLILFSNPGNHNYRIMVVAYWALILRHVRAWIFANHADLYWDKEIFWTISIGIPIVDKDDQKSVRMYEDLMRCAWRVAGKNRSINREGVKKLISRLAASNVNDDEPDIRVVPELAAQIYGFVVSNSFDDKAKNIYMMFDVGGGSLDSAIFHVKRGRGNRWVFSYFNAAVQPLGVLNLHRYRLEFWDRCLREHKAPKSLLKKISRSISSINDLKLIPQFFEDYFHGISVFFNHEKHNPDWIFGKKALKQVKIETLCKAVTSLRMLSREDVKNLSFYACGGGSGMQYYKSNLIQEVEKPSANSTWLRANEKLLPRPDNFHAEGVRNKDFDRLSVAYGLSQIELDGDDGLIWPDPLIKQHFDKLLDTTEVGTYISKDMV
ncbi:acetate and sugar kinases/Hsc70/actin family protein [Nitrincola tapanii]|uniref:Hsp70 family protein n=1 Tax=Nitrincola tapanii TaxID=1708751 RepID=A0A5A9VY80_9GAMM|nr:hypothetical protein [Nitrincola tapanii]KAA0873517.1 hypothetical protein E1H14_13010 [Nitrincola tapanii]